MLNAPDMSVGVELARARRVCGLSIEDISTRTNVTVGTLAAIENNQVDDIPTVEVRGALRAYAAEVQLDPEDVVHRYFAEFEASIDEFPSEATVATDIEYRDSIQPSDRHSSGLAMRFPRIVRIRPDKSSAEIDTLAAARKLARRT